MKKLFILFATALIFVGCNTNNPEDLRLNFVGSYSLSGETNSVSTVTNSKGTQTSTNKSSFNGKKMEIKLDPSDSKKMIVEWEAYGNTTATIKNKSVIRFNNTTASFIDDGSLMGKGGRVTIETSYPDDAVLEKGVLTFSVISECTEINPSNGAVFYQNAVTTNKAVKIK